MLLQRLYSVSCHGFAKVELKSMITDLAINVMMRMVAGKRYNGESVTDIEEAKLFKDIMGELLELIQSISPVDLLPFLQWIDYGGFKRRLINGGKQADAFFQRLLDEHRSDWKDKNTMISHLITLQEMEPEYYTDEIIKGLIMVMMVAGTETIAVAIEWAMCNVLNNPNVLKKAKLELDAQIGEENLMGETDIVKLPYLQCIIQENLRLYPGAPLLAPHESSDHCNLGGYDIPPETMLFVNAWAIQRDPDLWDDPTSFKPERFENGKGGDNLVYNYKLLPFGFGRRACPGEGFANRLMGLTLGSLLQCFEWEKVNGEEIDMSEKTVITMCKVKPLQVMCKACPILQKFFT